ncbi:MAG: hypothetical protein U5M72_00275 [Pseudomonas sp.]|nr:hypothetical protein [Pseudomonas sp.]
MKLTRYLYKGPQSGAQLRVGAKAELLEVQLHPGKPVDLPADHEYTLVLIALKHLEPIIEEAAAAPAPAKKEARQ